MLIDYQKLMREVSFEHDGSCNTTDPNGLPNNLAKMTECVPEEHRCSSHIVNCNKHEKYVENLLLHRNNIKVQCYFWNSGGEITMAAATMK